MDPAPEARPLRREQRHHIDKATQGGPRGQLARPHNIPIWDIIQSDNSTKAPVPKTVYTADYRAFLKRLCQARMEKGLTQIDVASRLGKHQSYVAKCESGARRIDVIELAQFAHVYDKPLEYFLRR